jgi:hypothetical protein
MDIWLLPWDDFLHNDIQPDILQEIISDGYPHAIPAPREVPLHATDSTPPRLLGSNLESGKPTINVDDFPRKLPQMWKIHENPLFVDKF